ncbi:MAG: molybdopterin-dependent oxidoreductase, partial [Rhodospirillales bacterium]|nr:molybdopterin-dependent oxidoreductase [Rhodospirillales bacterium]
MTDSIMRTPEKSDRIGAALAHDSAYKHATGEALFLDDAPEPRGCLHAFLVLSPWAHARITGIDLSPALEMPGVQGAVTAADIPGVNDIAEAPFEEPLFPESEAEYIGHPIAAIAAESFAQARKAAKKVRIEGEPLPAVMTTREAYERDHWLKAPVEMKRGTAEAELANAPMVLEGELEVGGQDHFYLETQAALALPQEDRDMMVWSSTQHPSEVQHVIARLLGIRQNDVTVEVRRMGGAFGGKESQATLIAGIAAILARKTRRPVKLRLDRDTDMIVTGKRHDFLLRWKVGLKPDGRILAVDMDLAAGCGWSVDLSPAVISRALSHADNAYYYPHVRLRGLACKTHTQSNTAFRGFGGPQGMIGAEAMMDQIARTLKIDPIEVRRRNFYRPGTERDQTPYHQHVEHFHLPDMVERVLASSDYRSRRREIDAFNASSPVIRKGLALSPVKFGISFNKIQLNQAGALVHVY